VALSAGEMRLIEKYCEPTITDIIEIREMYEGTDKQYEQVKVSISNANLSKFSLSASVDGHRLLENLQGFESAVGRALDHAISHLKSRGARKDEKTLRFRSKKGLEDAKEDMRHLRQRKGRSWREDVPKRTFCV